MTSVESPGSAWWREENRLRTDPDEATARGEALQRRLFGTPEPEPTDDQPPDPDPDAA